MPAAANRLTSVQPSFALTSRAAALAQAANSGCVSPGGAAWATSITVSVSPSARWGGEHVFDVRQRLVAGPVGSEAVVERHDGPVRHDVARHAPSTNTACRAS